MVDRGCDKLVLASSIAAVGMQSPLFRPLELPMSDQHPCLDRDGYGFSKYMMEETTRYLSRQNPALDIINIQLSDVIRCFRLATESEHKAGVRIMNATGQQACVAGTVPEVMRAWYGKDVEQIDMSHFERRGHERDAVYSIGLIERELGFVPSQSVVPE